VRVAEVPGVLAADEHLPVILLGVLDEPGVLLGDALLSGGTR
jgi:hypothetical protein